MNTWIHTFIQLKYKTFTEFFQLKPLMSLKTKMRD